MLSKKMYIEKQKNNKVYVQLPTLFDLSKQDIRIKLVNIIKSFSSHIYARITSRNLEIENDVKMTLQVKNIIVNRKKKNTILFFKLSEKNLSGILEIIESYDDALLELFYFENELELKLFSQREENETNCFFYICDNNGPFLIFSTLKYDYEKVIETIDNILK